MSKKRNWKSRWLGKTQLSPTAPTAQPPQGLAPGAPGPQAGSPPAGGLGTPPETTGQPSPEAAKPESPRVA